MTRFAVGVFALIALAAGAGAACAETRPAVAIVSAETTLAGEEQTLSWSTEPAGAPVDVAASADPALRPAGGDIVSRGDRDGHAVYKNGAHRTYFLISARDGGDFERTALRVLPLAGGRNFRDLGGYRTADGRSVKWGMVFRSGALSKLTDADYAYLADLNIRSVIDFRSNGERASEPTNWRAGKIDIVTKDYAAGGDGDAFVKALMTPGATPESVAAAMMEFYRAVPDQFADQYAEMFRRLTHEDGALLFHCTAGKDRTGVAGGLLLTALGVPRATVLADYALTEKVLDYREMFSAPAQPNDAYAGLRRLPPELITPLMRSDPRYLEAAFAAIEQRYGTIENYFRVKLGLTPEDIAALRGRLLETTG